MNLPLDKLEKKEEIKKIDSKKVDEVQPEDKAAAAKKTEDNK